jgi:Fe-Mn family superoxide dismutase
MITTITRRGLVLGAFSGAALVHAAPDTPRTSGAPFQLPKLPYAADALEPHIDARTMEIHHDKHHQGYVDNLNKAIGGHPAHAGKSVEELLRQLQQLPESIRTAVRNNGGGHANHSLFWQCLSPKPKPPKGAFATLLGKTFGNVAKLQEQMNTAGLGQFGSGWAWLVTDGKGALSVENSPNQDSPLMQGKRPLLGIDVWEHAYYLKYQNRRADYLKAIWNVVDWDFVSARYEDRAR